MEFNFIINKFVPLNSQGIGIYESKKNRIRSHSQVDQQLQQMINAMGEKSAHAQGLKQVVTHYDKIVGTDQKLYIAAEGRICKGILKIGTKNLFHRDNTGKVKEISPLCVLDFYVHESCQRQGYGKHLFEAMLTNEQVTPQMIAYDRPSPKLLAFLKKHYNLNKYIPQNNNFVVFDQYFQASHNQTQQNTQSKSHSYLQSYDAKKPPLSQQQNQNQKDQLLKQENSQNQSRQSQRDFVNVGRSILQQEDTYKSQSKNQSNIENQINIMNNPQIPLNNQYIQKDEYLCKLQSYLNEKGVKKPSISQNDDQLDQLSQQIKLAEKELNKVNQQIDRKLQKVKLQFFNRKKNNLSQDPLIQKANVQNTQNISNITSPWANTGYNYYSTSSSNYGNHLTYYKK